MSRWSKAVLSGLAVASVMLLSVGQAIGATVLWTAPGTTVYINPGEPLEFENPLLGTETIQGYPILEWLDADYAPGPPPWYDDWTPNGAPIDGDANQIWMRAPGQSISTASTVSSSVVSIHLAGDSNDGLADVLVDGSVVAQLDMGTMPLGDEACVLVTGLANSMHTIAVAAMGPGQYGLWDVATFGAAVLQAPVVKWTQLPDLQVTGMDVHATDGLGFEPRVLADDFECTVTGPLTEIDVWGSWYLDNLPYGDPRNARFRLSIHEDIPDPDGPGPLYSMPGQPLWMRDFIPGEFEVELYAGNLEEWYMVPDGQAVWPGDTMCWLYRFYLDPTDFRQEGTPGAPVIYWLDVQAFPDEDYRHFGWKTSVDHWNDDAVWGEGQDPPAVWYELDYPGLHQFPEDAPLDLAFRIIGEEEPVPDHVICEPQPPNHPTEYWYEVVRNVDWYCDFHVRVYDPDPCNYSNWNVPSDWVFAVHKVGDEWWASWWDPTPACSNAITGTNTFRFSNSNPAVWGDWSITQGNSSDPHYMVLDSSANHTAQPDGYGYRVHVPSDPDAEEYKWLQAPDLNSTGIDVLAVWLRDVAYGYVLADDFLCTESDPITEIVVWGSWYHDEYPLGDPGNVSFRLSIHSDNPGPPHSMPADLLWMREFAPGDFQADLCADGLNEGFLEPPYDYYPSADTVCWKYTFPLAPGEFTQQGSPAAPVVYWLDVQAVVDDMYMFGWKTSVDHWNDNAVWAWGEDGPWFVPWEELIYPQGHLYVGDSIDLAFAIVGGCPLADTPLPGYPPDAGFGTTNRYLSMVPQSTGTLTALRVTLASMPPPFTGDNGCQLWVGHPGPVTEASGSSAAFPPPTFTAADLQTTPDCRDWGLLGLIDVSDDEVVPSATYTVEAIDCSCDFSNPANYSAPLTINTSKWGDIVGNHNPAWVSPTGYVDNWDPPNGVVDFIDISAMVDKFKNTLGAPRKARADIAPDNPDRKIDFVDISAVVDAFRADPYPYNGPDECP